MAQADGSMQDPHAKSVQLQSFIDPQKGKETSVFVSHGIRCALVCCGLHARKYQNHASFATFTQTT
jgi:hypothetical protein